MLCCISDVYACILRVVSRLFVSFFSVITVVFMSVPCSDSRSRLLAVISVVSVFPFRLSRMRMFTCMSLYTYVCARTRVCVKIRT